MEQDEQGGFAAEYSTKSQAVDAWNTRPETDRLIAEAVAAEQERCAKVADEGFGGRLIAAKIRGEWIP